MAFARSAFAASLVLVLSFATGTAQAAAPHGSTLIRDVTIVDVEHAVFIPHQDLVVRNGRIAAVFPARDGTAEALKSSVQVDRVFDGQGYFATPGLIDAHVHNDLFYYEKQADGFALPLYIANGVTTLRDCAGSSQTLGYRREIEAGTRIGPRMVIASPFITSQKVDPGGNEFQVTTPADAQARVESFLAAGYNGIKVDSTLNLDVYEAAAATAARHNSYLFGHSLVANPRGYWEVLTNETLSHFRTAEHLALAFGDFMQSNSSPYYHKADIPSWRLTWSAPTYMDFSKAPALVALLRAKHSIVSPTLSIINRQLEIDTDGPAFLAAGIDGFHRGAVSQYFPDYYFGLWTEMYKTWGFGMGTPLRAEAVAGVPNLMRLVKILDDAGIPIIAGTDTPARPQMVSGFALHDELSVYRAAGLSGWRVLRTATVSSAMALKMSGLVGVLRPGAYADIVLTHENPVANIEVLRHPAGVMSRGTLYTRSELDRMLAGVRDAARKIPTPAAGSNLRLEADTPVPAQLIQSKKPKP
jgi:hypothetical protein